MATVSVFNLVAGSSAPLLASGDVLPFVDISDTAQSGNGSLVKTTLLNFFANVPVPVNILSTSATAFTVAATTGGGSSAFGVDCSVASQSVGLWVTGAANGGTVAVAVVAGSAASLSINAKLTGTIGIGSVSTGRVTITPVCTITGALTLSSTTAAGDTVTITKASAAAGSAQLILAYDGSHSVAIWQDSTGLLNFLPSGGTPRSVFSAGALIVGSTVPTATATGVLEVQNSLTSVTGIATPGAYVASTATVFASVVSGATLMGFGTTGDVTLKNRAGTDVIVVTSNTLNVTMAGALAFTTNIISTTALATPSAYVATTGAFFASTVSGATLMGFGTTGDVTLKNRAGTDVIVVTSNTTGVTMAGALAITGALSGVTTITGSSTLTLNATTTSVIGIGTSGTGQINLARGVKNALVIGNTLTALGTVQNSTPTIAQLIGGVVTQTSATGAGTVTIPTGTLISGGVTGAATGDSFVTLFANLGGTFTLTITGASGSTVRGNAAVPTGKNALLYFICTGANAWDCYVIPSA